MLKASRRSDDSAGDGVLFYDADEGGKISDWREYVPTNWAPGVGDDMEAVGWGLIAIWIAGSPARMIIELNT